jgi:hypothetical protein
MRVTQRTPDTLVVEEAPGTAILNGSICLGVGAISVIIGWTNEKWLFVVVGAVFALFGLKIFLFSRTRTHRFERWRGMLAIDSKGCCDRTGASARWILTPRAKTSIEGSKHSV